MTTQIIFSITYVLFVIFIAMSCIYEEQQYKGRTARIFKTLSAACATGALVSYFFFLKNVL